MTDIIKLSEIRDKRKSQHEEPRSKGVARAAERFKISQRQYNIRLSLGKSSLSGLLVLSKKIEELRQLAQEAHIEMDEHWLEISHYLTVELMSRK